MIKMITALLLVIALTMVAVATVFAHEDSEEGDYRFVVGFLHEPAYEGEMNAVSIRVTKVVAEEESKDQGHHGGSMEMEVDVEKHGAIFLSPMIPAGESFEFQMPDKFAGMAIPFHNHLDHDVTGVISVGEKGQDGGMTERVTVSIGDSAFSPADVSVDPDSTIVFVNNTRLAQNVTSGVMDDGGGMTMGTQESRQDEKTAPVEGLQDTLQVEVTHVPSEVSKTMSLRTVYDDPGHYVADLIPTSPGHYRFRVFGAVEGNPLDRTFDSMAGGGGFDDVQVVSVIHFPETVASAREVEGVVRGAQTTAQQAQQEAMSASSGISGATTLGIIGIVAGAIGIALGGGALVMSLRRRN